MKKLNDASLGSDSSALSPYQRWKMREHQKSVASAVSSVQSQPPPSVEPPSPVFLANTTTEGSPDYYYDGLPQAGREETTDSLLRLPVTAPASALDKQQGGDHYKKLKIQPLEYIHANGIPFAEGCVIKYVSRWRDKGGVQDLEKAKHFIELLIELETRT